MYLISIVLQYYNIAGLLKLGTKFNYEQINKAVNQLIFNHDCYRIQVTFKSGNAKQYIKALLVFAFLFIQVSKFNWSW